MTLIVRIIEQGPQGDPGPIATPQMSGADATGAADSTAAFDLFAAKTDLKVIPPGLYQMSATWTHPVQDVTMISAGGVSFTGARPDLENLIPYQNGMGDIWSQGLFSKIYGAAWALFGNIFQIASYVKSVVAGPPVVAVFGQGEAAASGARTWGGNFVGYAAAAGGIAQGVEVNCGVLAAGGVAYGLTIASAGSGGQPEAALQIQSNNAAGQFKDGIKFNWRATEGLATGNLMAVSGVAGATAQRFLHATNITFSAAEIDLPSFVVGATPATVDARVMVQASSGTTARLQLSAVSANANLQVRAKGTGQSQLAGGSGTVRVAASETGLGFNGTAPMAVPSVTGDLKGNAAAASLVAQLAALGLVSNATSSTPLAIADVAGLVAALDARAPRAWTAFTANLGDGFGVSDYETSIADAACTPSSLVELQLAATADGDENEPELVALTAMIARPSSGSFGLSLAFADPHSGPLKLQYRIN